MKASDFNISAGVEVFSSLGCWITADTLGTAIQ
jgi:hypothetical protein